MQNTPLTQEQFIIEATRLISTIKDHITKLQCTTELNYYAGTSNEDERNRMTYGDLSVLMKFIIGIVESFGKKSSADDFPNPPLGEPFFDKVNDAAHLYANGYAGTRTIVRPFKDGAQYGFNLRNVFCEDLKEDTSRLRKALTDLEETYRQLLDENKKLNEIATNDEKIISELKAELRK